MKLFLAQTAALSSPCYNSHFCKVLEVFANYIRAPHRKTVEIITVGVKDMASLGIESVSSSTAYSP